METGQKHSVKTTSTKNILKRLSIQVSLNGLSFCILDSNKNIICNYFKSTFVDKATPITILDELKSAFNTKPSLQENFETVTLVHDNELSTLVPEALFSEAHLADYLKFNATILQTDYITYDTLGELSVKNVYVPFININNFIFDQFGAFEYHHSNTILLRRLLPEVMRVDELVVVYISTSHFEVLNFKDKKLQLLNRFEYHSEEDFIYYVLFTLEQLQLDPESVEIALLGINNEEHPLFEIAYKYIRNVSILEPNIRYKLEKEVAEQSPEYTIINSF